MQTAQCLRSGVGRGGEQGGADIVGTKKAQEFLKMTTITTITTIDPTCTCSPAVEGKFRLSTSPLFVRAFRVRVGVI